MRMNLLRSVFAALFLSSIVLFFAIPLADAQCSIYIYDGSYINYSASYGYNNWELVADFVNVPNDEGSYGAWGYCTGGYYDCSNTYVTPGTVGGTETFNNIGDLGPQEDQVSWTLDDYITSWQSCDNGNPDDEIEINTPHPYTTADFDIYCY